jgi:uncharacterized protein (TIGR02285 family)
MKRTVVFVLSVFFLAGSVVYSAERYSAGTSSDTPPASAGTPIGNDTPTLTWLTLDWQPAWIYKDELAGTGYIQQSVGILQKHLPGYRHRNENVLYVRIYDILKARNSCFAASSYQGNDLAGDRRNGVITSAPSYLFFYHGLVARKEARPHLMRYAEGGKVRFLEVLKDKTLVGAYQPGRNYSTWLNGVFADPELTKGMFHWSGHTGLTSGMFKMLAAHRFDYFVDYSMLVNYHRATTGHEPEFEFYPIAEHTKPYGIGAIACSDTPFGRQVIRQINTALAAVRPDAAYQQALARWLKPEGLETEYDRIWQQEVLSLAD